MSSSTNVATKLKLWLRAAESYAREANRQFTRIKRQLTTLSADDQSDALDEIGMNNLQAYNFSN